MRRIALGRTGLDVSEICLGSMTWGTQNSEAEGHAQLDFARDQGIDFIDTAELYPVNPIRPETTGRTEEIIGSWLAARGRREDVVIATKIVGIGSNAIAGGPAISPARIREAVENSLRRLQTDYIDLYQLHWPNRGSYHFRALWRYDPTKQGTARVRDDMEACLETLAGMVAEGKIRHLGLSNETSWGTGEWLKLAEAGKGPRMATIQNEYSLLCRYFDADLAETCHHEEVTMLAYSPLAAGMLSGKYSGDATPAGSRRAIVPDLGGRAGARAFDIADLYVGVAREAGLDPVTMAIRWVMERPGSIIPIIGGTSVDQIAAAIAAAQITLPREVKDAIAQIHRDHPMPF
jgi:aryl-alcohol dehydrogenase-like predicted oxidoreductase